MKLQLQFLASAALVLLSAVPGFAEKPSAAVAKPIESFSDVIEALIDDAADLFREAGFDAEEEPVSTAKGKSKSRSSGRKSSRRKGKSRSSRRRSSRRRRRRNGKSSSSDYRRYSKDMCRGRIRNSRDRRTCDRIEDRYCSSRSLRRRNSRLCRRVGFPSVAEGANEDTSETYAEDTEVFSEDTLDDIDLIIGDIEDEFELIGNALPYVAVAKPIESFDAELIDDPADLFREAGFDAEEEPVSTAKGKSKSRSSGRKSSRRKGKSRSSRRRSSRRRRNGKSSSSDYRRYSKDMCRGRIRNSRDRRTCDRIEDRYCSSRSLRRRNSRLCRRVGFPSVTEGANEDASETYAEDTEVFSEDTLDDIDLIIGDIEDELKL